MLALIARRPSVTLLGGIALVIALANPAAAPPGDLDPTFDGDGKVTTDPSEVEIGCCGGSDRIEAVAIQGDGKIVVAGGGECGCPPSGVQGFALARYNTDGSLDLTFGDGDGVVLVDIGFAFDEANSVGFQGDGKIVAAGVGRVVSGTDDFALVRLNADGSLDTTFDGDGMVTTDFAGGTDIAQGVVIQGDGKIVAAGVDVGLGLRDLALARYNTDGSLDPTFDGDGMVTTDFAGGTDEAQAVALQGDGKILAAGSSVASGTFDFALARYNTDGSFDPTFDGDGMVTTDFAGGHDRGFAVALQGAGRIVAAGSATISGNSDFALARYETDGSLDPIFSGDGKVITNFSGDSDIAFGVAIQGDGKIVAAGRALVPGEDFALARYTVCRRTSRPTSIPPCR